MQATFPAELIKAGGRTICSEIHKLINSIWNKEELAEEWKQSITAPVYKKGDRTDCSNYRGLSLLSTTYNTLSNILLSRLTPYAEKITDHILCIHQVLEKKCEYSEAVPKLFYIPYILESNPH